MTKNSNLFYQFIYGWGDGAGGRAMDKARSEHPDAELTEVYVEGYQAGQLSRRESHAQAAIRFGIKLLPIRPMRPNAPGGQ